MSLVLGVPMMFESLLISNVTDIELGGRVDRLEESDASVH